MSKYLTPGTPEGDFTKFLKEYTESFFKMNRPSLLALESYINEALHFSNDKNTFVRYIITKSLVNGVQNKDVQDSLIQTLFVFRKALQEIIEELE